MVPFFWQKFSAISLLDEEVGTALNKTRVRMDGIESSSSDPNPRVEKRARAWQKRKRADNVPTESDIPESAQALAKVWPVLI